MPLMKAIIETKSGPPEVLQLREVEKPAPKADEILIRIHAATVTRGDAILRKLHPLLRLPLRIFGIRSKKIPGTEFAGEVEAVGEEVTRFRVGDAVFGTTTALGSGAYAEYLCAREKGLLAAKPANMTYEEAAAVPIGGMTALQLLRRGSIKPGQKVLVYGASGSVGTYAVQIARSLGAEIAGVCSAANVELVTSLSAEEVIDYTAEDFTERGETYDVVFDAVGKLSSSQGKRALKEGGSYLSVRSPTSETTEDLVTLRELIEAGKLRSVIDRRYPLEQIAEAHRYVDTGRKRGNVVITVAQREKR